MSKDETTMLITMVPVALGLALNACPFGSEDDVHGGYGVVEGVVTLRDGTPMQAAEVRDRARRILAQLDG